MRFSSKGSASTAAAIMASAVFMGAAGNASATAVSRTARHVKTEPELVTSRPGQDTRTAGKLTGSERNYLAKLGDRLSQAATAAPASTSTATARAVEGHVGTVLTQIANSPGNVEDGLTGLNQDILGATLPLGEWLLATSTALPSIPIDIANCPYAYGSVPWSYQDTCLYVGDNDSGNDYFMVVLTGSPGLGVVSPDDDSQPVWWI